MSGVLKLFGFALLLLSAQLIGRAYSAYCKRRTLETEGFLVLLCHIKEQISLFLSTPEKILEGYSDERLESSGFLKAVREGESMESAFKGASLALGEETEKRLMLFFSDFGKSYREGELKRCEIFCGELEKILSSEREEEPKRIKLGYTILFASALAIIILLI